MENLPDNYKDIYIKTIRVIESCETQEQIKNAAQYLNLAVKSQQQIHKDMLFTQWLVKYKQLESI